MLLETWRHAGKLRHKATTPRAVGKVVAATKPASAVVEPVTVEIIRGDKRAREVVREQ